MAVPSVEVLTKFCANDIDVIKSRLILNRVKYDPNMDDNGILQQLVYLIVLNNYKPVRFSVKSSLCRNINSLVLGLQNYEDDFSIHSENGDRNSSSVDSFGMFSDFERATTPSNHKPVYSHTTDSTNKFLWYSTRP